jgi:hypothetical protein
MQPELQKLFETQAAWQRARAKLSWPEKIRMAETMREGARQLRLLASAKPGIRQVPSAGASPTRAN